MPTDTFQWQRCDSAGQNCVDLPGETNAAHIYAAGDVGFRLRIKGWRDTLFIGTSAPTAIILAAGSTPSAGVQPFGAIRLGGSYASLPNKTVYGVVVGDAADASAVGGLAIPKSLVYMDFFEACPFFAGISIAQASSIGAIIGREPAPWDSNYLLDPRKVALRQVLIDNIHAFLTAHPGVDGIYTDNCIADPRGLWGGSWPPGFSNSQEWYDAVTALVSVVAGELRARGWTVWANQIAFFPGDNGAFPGTSSNDGSAAVEWVRRIAPHVDGCMYEFAMHANGHLRSTANTWDNNWAGFNQWVPAAQSGGADAVYLINIDGYSEQRFLYPLASLLIEWDGQGGGVMAFGSGDPYNASWTRVPGLAAGAKTAVGVGYKRVFDNLTVYINPHPSSSQDFGGGVVLGPVSARII